jgi:hypothetical protein
MVSNYTGSGAHCYANGPCMSLLAARAEAQAEQLPEPGFPFAYSPKCLEGEFCELRHYGVLRSWRRYPSADWILRGATRCPRIGGAAPRQHGSSHGS